MDPGQVALHPYQGVYQYSILRFIAPKPGVFEVSAIFYAGDVGAVEVLIYESGRLVKLLGDTPTSYTFTTLLSAGDYVDFVVGPGTDTSLRDSTPLDITVRDVRCIGDTG